MKKSSNIRKVMLQFSAVALSFFFSFATSKYLQVCCPPWSQLLENEVYVSKIVYSITLCVWLGEIFVGWKGKKEFKKLVVSKCSPKTCSKHIESKDMSWPCWKEVASRDVRREFELLTGSCKIKHPQNLWGTHPERGRLTPVRVAMPMGRWQWGLLASASLSSPGQAPELLWHICAAGRAAMSCFEECYIHSGAAVKTFHLVWHKATRAAIMENSGTLLTSQLFCSQ